MSRSCLCSPVNRRNSQILSTLLLNLFLITLFCLGTLSSGKQTEIICHNTSLRPPPSPPRATPSARAPAAPLSLPSSPALVPREAEYCARGHSIGQRRRPAPFLSAQHHSPPGAPVGGALPALPVGPSIGGGKAASITRVVTRHTQPPVPSYAVAAYGAYGHHPDATYNGSSLAVFAGAKAPAPLEIESTNLPSFPRMLHCDPVQEEFERDKELSVLK